MLVSAVFPLIWVGGLVTSTDAGMAVPDWPTTYGYNLFLYPLETWVFGPWDLFIEHGHRLLGALVGVLAIALVVGTAWKDRRSWVKLLALTALGLIITQGIIGGMRVRWDARSLAMVHGCLGALVFGVAVSLAVVTSSWWRQPPRVAPANSGQPLQRLTLLTTLLAYVQLILGAQLRHIPVYASPMLFRVLVFAHLIMAAVVVAHGTMLWWQTRRTFPQVAKLVRPARWLAMLLWLQVGLGLGTWVVKFAWPAWLPPVRGLSAEAVLANGWYQAILPTMHTAMGSMILGLSLVVLLRSWRLMRAANLPATAAFRVGELAA